MATHEAQPSRQTGAILQIVLQQAEEAATLREARTVLLNSKHIKLRQLSRCDDRLAAYLDGLLLAGNLGGAACERQLERVGAGSVFAAGVWALESARLDHLDRLLSLSEVIPAARRGLISAFGWVDATRLRGLVARLLASNRAIHRIVGLAACDLHRADPGRGLLQLLGGGSALRARALRTIGELGQVDALSQCIEALDAKDHDGRFWAAWSAVLLGERTRALAALIGIGRIEGPLRSRAFCLTMQLLNREAIREVLLPLARDGTSTRWAIIGAGISGDPTYVTWLIGLMGDEKLSRAAGEAFSLITGADLVLLNLERRAPEGVESGPNDDPSNPDVELDPDDGLPWPDPARVQAWWGGNGARFAAGNRYFVGEPLGREHCIEVLKSGYQRQRVLAAHYLCLLEPGTVLFNTSAPAWRQQQQLAAMS